MIRFDTLNVGRNGIVKFPQVASITGGPFLRLLFLRFEDQSGSFFLLVQFPWALGSRGCLEAYLEGSCSNFHGRDTGV